jgi:hypothetical protein
MSDIPANVVSKSPAGGTIGNDHVVSKCDPCVSFGNDAMFVRVRRRTLKGGHQSLRAHRKHHGCLVTASASFDVVRAVRINGKPRQKFILGLGSLKTPQVRTCEIFWFWRRALFRMRRHGFDQQQRLRLIDALVRKGVPKPSYRQCEEWVRNTRFINAVDFADLQAGAPPDEGAA